MPRKKQESVLGLPAPLSPAPLSSNGYQTLFGGGRALTRREEKIAENLHEQELVIDAERVKAMFADDRMNEVKRHAAAGFVNLAEYLNSIREEAAGTPYQPYVDEFCAHVTQIGARHAMGVIEVNSKKTADELARSLYPSPEQLTPKKLTLQERLLGRVRDEP